MSRKLWQLYKPVTQVDHVGNSSREMVYYKLHILIVHVTNAQTCIP